MKNNLQAKSGIYKITINDYYIYIGQSVDVKIRWSSHLNILKHNKHCNKKLQNVFNKYPDKIKFEILEHCDVDKLDEREMYWIDHYKSYNTEWGLNMDLGGSSHRKYKTIKEAEAAALEKRKEYHKVHKERFKQYGKEYRKQWYVNNKKELKVKSKQYYQDNKEKCKERAKQYYQDIKKQKGILSYFERRKLQFETRYNLSRPLTDEEWNIWKNTKNNQQPYAIKFLKSLSNLTFTLPLPPKK